MPTTVQEGEKVFRGIPVSAGVKRGKILLLGKSHDDPVTRYGVAEADVQQQLQRLDRALALTRRQLHDLQRQVSAGMGAKDASIFEAQLLILEDPTLLEEVTRVVQGERVNIESAWQSVAEKFAHTFSSLPDEYLRERAADVRDVADRVLDNLLGRDNQFDPAALPEPVILIAHDLPPSATARLDRNKVLGFATDVGGKTSHTAIMARALQIPAVVGLHDASAHLQTGQYALLDGYNGVLVINPTDQTLFEYGQLVRKQAGLQETLREVLNQPALTLDGVPITLSANVEQVGDTEAVKASGADGVGLFRTEFLFINRDALPDEEEQFQAYRQVAAALKPQPVILRTLDLGGDKFLTHLGVPQEMNPFLGWRAIRFCLHEPAIFKAQLRAILRASAEGNVKIMYPMVSGVEELNQAQALLEECKAELRAAGRTFDEQMETGVMIEIPSAVMVADALAKRVKFFSVGTNDLIQYSLAVDRLNERIAHLYEPTHPAVLRLIKMTVEAGRRNGIWTGVCGEMAGELPLVPLLLGLGVSELSVTPSSVPQAKFLIRRLKLTDAKELADWALQQESAKDILSRAQEFVRHAAPGLFAAA
jgi:phosphotransferase system enzyme I (PtsI)